jgi:hypothetical protein
MNGVTPVLLLVALSTGVCASQSGATEAPRRTKVAPPGRRAARMPLRRVFAYCDL